MFTRRAFFGRLAAACGAVVLAQRLVTVVDAPRRPVDVLLDDDTDDIYRVELVSYMDIEFYHPRHLGVITSIS